MPMGISPAPEVFQRKLTQELEGLPGIIADDILITGQRDTQEAVDKDHDDTGLEAALMQGGKPVAFASRAQTPTECGNAQKKKDYLLWCSVLKNSTSTHMDGKF